MPHSHEHILCKYSLENESDDVMSISTSIMQSASGFKNHFPIALSNPFTAFPISIVTIDQSLLPCNRSRGTATFKRLLATCEWLLFHIYLLPAIA
jgi:hypothetical protein